MQTGLYMTVGWSPLNNNYCSAITALFLLLLLFQKPSKDGRAVFILGSVAPHSNKSVVQQFPAALSNDDRQVLTELGLPPDKWDNLNVLLTMYNSAEPYDVFSVQVSKSGVELSRSYVLDQIKYLLINSVQKEGGTIKVTF